MKIFINIGYHGGVCEVGASVSQNISGLITSMGSASVKLLPKPCTISTKVRICTF
jgi:hypothetical protein